jgi:uncharacterized protein YhaN
MEVSPMRIDRLDLIAFGGFTDSALDLSGERLQLVYGPNEAGKTTARVAITKLLYNFDFNEAYAFVHPLNALRLGATLRADGTIRSVLRHKRNKDPLVDATSGQPVTEAEWTALLGGLSRADFSAMLTLGWEDLEAGTRQLLASDGALGETIFAAGYGVRTLGTVLGALEKEADDLFRPTGKKDLINSALRAHSDARREAREASVRPSQYEQAAREEAGARKALEELRRRRQKRTETRNRISVLVAVLPPLQTRSQALDDLVALRSEGPVAPRSWAERVNTALGDRETLTAALIQARQRVERLTGRLDAITVDEELVGVREKIEDLVGRAHTYEVGQRDRAGLIEGRDEAEHAALTVVRELTGIDGDPRRLDQATPVLDATEQIAGARDQWMRCEQERTTVERDAATLRDEIAALDDDLAALPEPPDTTTLRSVVDSVRDRGDLDAAVSNAREILEEAARARSEAAALLGLAVSDISRVLVSPAPGDDEIEHVLGRIDELAATARNKRERAQEIEEAQKESELQLSDLAKEAELPSAEDLAERRERRANLWALVKAAWIGHEAVADARNSYENDEALALAHETATDEADNTADRLWQEAGRTARRERLLAQREQYRIAREQALEEEEAAGTAARELYFTWKAAWPALRLPELPASLTDLPISLRRFGRDLGALRDRNREFLAASRDHRNCYKTRLRDRQRLATLAHKCGADVPEGTGLAPLLSVARTLAENLETATRDRKAKVDQLVEKKRLLPTRLRTAEEAADTEEAARSEVLRLLGPYAGTVTSTRDAGTVQNRLARLRDHIDERDDKTRRIDGIDRRAAEFEKELAGLTSYAPDLATLSPAEAARELGRRLKATQAAQVERNTLKEEHDGAQAEVDDATEGLTGVNERLALLAAEQGIDKIDHLEAAAQRALDADDIQKRIREAEALLVEVGAGRSIEDLEADIAGRDIPALNSEIQAIDGDLKDIDEKEAGSQSQQIQAAAALAAMDGSGMAAAAAARAEQAFSKAREGAERYVRILLARYLANTAIRRYRDAQENPILKTASEFLAEVTEGRYVQLAAEDSGSGARLSVIAGSGQELTVPEALSNGTRDQLCFALRLAAISQAIAKCGPMPVIVDDVLVNFDDDRAKAALRCLAALARETQVILFTHHRHVLALAADALGADEYVVRELALQPA